MCNQGDNAMTISLPMTLTDRLFSHDSVDITNVFRQ